MPDYKIPDFMLKTFSTYEKLRLKKNYCSSKLLRNSSKFELTQLFTH